MIAQIADVGLQAFGLFIVVCIAMFVAVLAFHVALGVYQGFKGFWRKRRHP